MGQLVIVVMAIGLLAILSVAGINYMNSDLGARTEAIRQIAVSRNAIETGIATYRIANSGHLPDGKEWKTVLDGYVPETAFRVPGNLKWKLKKDEAENGVGSYLCLTATDTLPSDAVLYALEQSAKSSGGVFSMDCNLHPLEEEESFSVESGAKPSLSIPIEYRK